MLERETQQPAAPKYAVARPGKAPHRANARFFAGDFTRDELLPLPRAVTTGAPDKAKAYEDRIVATVVVAYLNTLHRLRTGLDQGPWIVMELPEAWTS